MYEISKYVLPIYRDVWKSFYLFDFSDLKHWSQIWAEILNFQL